MELWFHSNSQQLYNFKNNAANHYPFDWHQGMNSLWD